MIFPFSLNENTVALNSFLEKTCGMQQVFGRRIFRHAAGKDFVESETIKADRQCHRQSFSGISMMLIRRIEFIADLTREIRHFYNIVQTDRADDGRWIFFQKNIKAHTGKLERKF